MASLSSVNNSRIKAINVFSERAGINNLYSGARGGNVGRRSESG